MDEPQRTPHASLKVRITRVTALLLLTQAIAVFASAGTLDFWQGWTYLGLQLVSMTATNAYFLKKDPALLERRLTIEETGETERVQRWVIALMRPLYLAMLVVTGLGHRFGGPAVPPAAVAAACLVFAVGAALVFRVFCENSYTSSVIEVDPQQTVVTTGPYRFVRHPMYAGVLLMGLATPPVLGSYLAEVFVPPMYALLVVRILAEERLLSTRLRGYAEYMKETPTRLIPGVW